MIRLLRSNASSLICRTLPVLVLRTSSLLHPHRSTVTGSFVGKVDGVDEVQMIVTSADRVRPHVQTVTTYAADFDEIQTIELDADDVDEWQYAYTNVAETVYENQVNPLPLKNVLGTTGSEEGTPYLGASPYSGTSARCSGVYTCVAQRQS